MLNTDIRSSTSTGRARPTSTTDCPRWPPRRPASVALRLDADIEVLGERQRAGGQEGAAQPAVPVADRDAEEVAGPVAGAALRRRPGHRRADRRAVQSVLVDVG